MAAWDFADIYTRSHGITITCYTMLHNYYAVCFEGVIQMLDSLLYIYNYIYELLIIPSPFKVD